jgi:hypothetical protein
LVGHSAASLKRDLVSSFFEFMNKLELCWQT